MEKAHFDILSALRSFKEEFTDDEAKEFLENNAAVSDHMELMNEYRPLILNYFFAKQGPNDTDVKYKIKPFAETAFLHEVAKREIEAADRQRERDLNQSVLRTNRIQRRILWLTMFLSTATVVIAWLDYKKNEVIKVYLLPQQSPQQKTELQLKVQSSQSHPTSPNKKKSSSANDSAVLSTPKTQNN